ncbi:MAG: ribbon-helix-helix protein, CopG family [Gemmatimonadaceae bacterium]
MKRKSGRNSRVREPIQIYILPDERRLLDWLANDTGLSRAEILRRGLRSFAAEHRGEEGPMQALLLSLRGDDWPADIASRHDDHLAGAHRDRHGA